MDTKKPGITRGAKVLFERYFLRKNFENRREEKRNVEM
jgi:hypothetical protein